MPFYTIGEEKMITLITTIDNIFENINFLSFFLFFSKKAKLLGIVQ